MSILSDPRYFHICAQLTNLVRLRKIKRQIDLRYESSTLILYKELSSPIFQSCQSVSQSVSQASVTPVQISTFCNIERHECPLLTQYHQLPTATAS